MAEGPLRRRSRGQWPTSSDSKNLRNALQMSSPGLPRLGAPKWTPTCDILITRTPKKGPQFLETAIRTHSCIRLSSQAKTAGIAGGCQVLGHRAEHAGAPETQGLSKILKQKVSLFLIQWGNCRLVWLPCLVLMTFQLVASSVVGEQSYSNHMPRWMYVGILVLLERPLADLQQVCATCRACLEHVHSAWQVWLLL